MANRNTETHFANVAHAEIQRSTFDLGKTHKTSFNAGDIVPLYVYSDILPGDTVSMGINGVIRMSTPLTPVMDDCYIDTYVFAIPYRLVWNHTKEFFGENRAGAWGISTEYTIPVMTADGTNGVQKGTICDYMGIPKGIAGLEFSALPIRAYVKTINEWFRNQNFTAPYTEYEDDTTRVQSNTNMVLGGAPAKAMRYADYFSTCLPEAQKPYANIGTGSGVTIPLGTTAPVRTGAETMVSTKLGDIGLTWSRMDTNARAVHSGGTSDTIGLGDSDFTYAGNNDPGANTQGTSVTIAPRNLYADLTNATAASINALRLAFQTQKILERMAVGGTRYTEIIKSMFGVTSPDARQQRPEYLCGERVPISMTQVVQNSSTDAQSPQGTTTAFSQTNTALGGTTKSFTEHTILLALGVVRQSHSYQQGLDRMWSRKRLLDFYNPKLAHLGEQPVYKKEIYATGVSANDDSVWGYQERWAEYKYAQNMITGELNSKYTTPLDSWHYGDKYDSAPTLGTTWLSETATYIDRTLAIKSSTHHQFIGDFYFNVKMTRPMPVYSTPGLLDHF